MNKNDGWIGVDLDGTLAKHDSDNFDPFIVGDPIPKMVNRVKVWIGEGKNVKIFTARVSGNDREHNSLVIKAISDWCLKNLGKVLPVTCRKDYEMVELWDDRAIQVIHNNGTPLIEIIKHLKNELERQNFYDNNKSGY